MQALVRDGTSEEQVALAEVGEPEPGPGDAVVAVEAFSLNRGELRLLAARPDGWRPGQDVAGTVLRAARDGTGPAEGTRVVAWPEQAGWAERVAVPAGRLAPLADHVTAAQAATLPIAGMTALRLLRKAPFLSGARVLVTGASGGVGHFAVEMASHEGAEVTALVRTQGREDSLTERGAARVVDELAEGDELDLVLESVGGRTLTTSLAHLAPRGRLLMFGNSSREPAELSFGAWGGGASGSQIEQVRVYETGEPPAFGDDLRLLAQWTADGRLHPHIGDTRGWDEIGAALRSLRDRAVAGKVVVRTATS